MSLARAINGAVRGVLGRRGSARSDDPREVHLLARAAGAPMTLEERLIVEALAGAGSLRLAELVSRAAHALYREEQRLGAGAADIGIFGSRLFAPDVARALEAGNGRLWTITARAPQE